MLQNIEVRAFISLARVFKERGWTNPMSIEIDGEITGAALLMMLQLELNQVESIFVNGKASTPEMAVISGGDRVALVSPGAPGPYRVLLGFRKMD